MASLAASGSNVRAAVRGPRSLSTANESVVVGDLQESTDWRVALADVRVVVHLAARVHVMQDNVPDPLAEFRRINVAGTLNLARQAAQAGVRRFVFVSSIKVNGEETLPGHSFTADDMPAPSDYYGISKLEAEQGLKEIASQTGMELVIIRPPLVYGPGVRANFHMLLRAVARGVPLPLGGLNNKRSLVALDNLVNFIETCITHPDAANQTFLVSDGEDLSTTELICRIANALSKPARLISIPLWMLKVGSMLLNKRDSLQRLSGNLQVDISKARDLLGWTPPLSVDEGLRRTVAEWR